MVTTPIPCSRRRRSTRATNGTRTGSSCGATSCGSSSTARTSSPGRWRRRSTLVRGRASRALGTGCGAGSAQGLGSRASPGLSPHPLEEASPNRHHAAPRHAQRAPGTRHPVPGPVRRERGTVGRQAASNALWQREFGGAMGGYELTELPGCQATFTRQVTPRHRKRHERAESRDTIRSRRSADGQVVPEGPNGAAAWSNVRETTETRSQLSRVSSRLTVRRGASRWLTVATGALILALVLEVAFGLPAAAPVRAQVMGTAKPSVTVYGAGEATVPAEVATVQIIIGQGGRQFGFSQDASGGDGFEYGRLHLAVRRPPRGRACTAGDSGDECCGYGGYGRDTRGTRWPQSALRSGADHGRAPRSRRRRHCRECWHRAGGRGDQFQPAGNGAVWRAARERSP